MISSSDQSHMSVPLLLGPGTLKQPIFFNESYGERPKRNSHVIQLWNHPIETTLVVVSSGSLQASSDFKFIFGLLDLKSWDSKGTPPKATPPQEIRP